MTDDLDIDAMIEGGHSAPLEADAIPDENQSHYCRSCEEPLVGIYCAECGQKNDDYRRPLWRLGKEAVASLTAMENRIWRTWAALLFKPGKVAREFADGRREHWSSPVRVYIFTSILLFGFMELTGTLFFALEVDLEPREGVTATGGDLSAEDVTYSFEEHWFPTQREIDAWNADIDFDLLRTKLNGRGGGSGFAAGLLEGFEGEDPYGINRRALDIVMAEEGVSEEDIAEFRTEMNALRASLPDTDIATRERIDGALAAVDAALEARADDADARSGDSSVDVTLTPGSTVNVTSDDARRFLLDYIRNPAIGNNILNKWLPRIVFLMMPLTMFIGAMFIRGRRRKWGIGKRDPDAKPILLYDHLVHAAYIHAVAYFILFLGIIAARYTPLSGAFVGIALLLYMLIYLPVSLYRMFDRGWVKTVWTAYGVAFIYLNIVVGLTTWAIVVGVQDQLERIA